MRLIKKILFTSLILFLLISSSTIVIASSSKTWIHRNKEIWINYSIYTIDREFQKNNTYDKLRIFFNECKTPEDFYNRIQEYVNDAYKQSNDPDISRNRLYLVVNEVTDNNATLHCIQQVNLFIGGIIAMHSHYDSNMRRYVLNDGCGDFKIEIWRSFDLHPPIYPYRSHVQLVIDKWNGTDSFEINEKTVDKIEVDTWEDEYREFNKRNDCLFYPFFPAKLNSVIFTRFKLLPF